MKIYSHIWDTEEETGSQIYVKFKDALRSLIETALEYAQIREHTERLEHYLGCLADGENPNEVYRKFLKSVEGWGTDWSPFWNTDTQKIKEQELPYTILQFNPYPETKPNESEHYIALFTSGLTDFAHYWKSSDNWTFDDDGQYDCKGLIGWADFPIVNEAPKVQYYVLFVYNDIEPEMIGPFQTPGERDQKARELKRVHGNEHGIFPLDSAGAVKVDSYSGFFFTENDKSL